MAVSVNRIPNQVRVTERDVRNAKWICFLAWTFAVYDFVLFGNLLPKLAEDHGWTEARSTGINTWVTIGTAVVAFAVGPMVDKLGRRKGIIVAVIGAALMSALTAAAGWVVGVTAGIGIVLLIVIRSVAGLGYAEQGINATYLSEMFATVYTDPARVRRRGLSYSVVQSGFSVGSVLAAASIYAFYPIGGWALCFIIGAFPALFMVWAARYLKESPQFSLRKEAEGLRRVGLEDDANALLDSAGLARRTASTPLIAAFKGESLRPTLVLSAAFFLIWFGALAFMILGTSVLNSADGKNIAFDNALVVLIVSNLSACVGYLTFGWIGDRLGRRFSISIGWILAGMCFVGMMLVPNDNAILIIILYSLGLLLLSGPFAALLFFGGESFPAHTRATGIAIVTAAGQIGAVTAGAVFTFWLSSGHSWASTALLWGALPIIAAGFVILAARHVPPGTVRID
ncbi:MFS transporter [Rhodococcus koreensis]|uniref:MFS transporter n=1 Tax=Rhodococcus koreensis TaxID=99653 RepID=UPI00366CB177